MTTDEIIKALPAKGTPWRPLVDTLRDHYLAAYADRHNGATPWPPTTIDEWDGAKGVRELRQAAMMIATCFVHLRAVRSSFIPASPETVSWGGGLLGGDMVVYTDRDAEEAATQEVVAIIDGVAPFRTHRCLDSGQSS
jgi:hypothetical protein